MGPFGADIGDANHQVRSDLPLDVEIPGLHIGRASAICRNQNHTVAAVLAVGCKRSRVRENACNAIINLGWATVGGSNRLPVKEPQAVLVGERTFLERLIEDSITAAEYGLVIDAVSEAHARTERFRINVLWARPSVSSSAGSKISVGPGDTACSRICKSRINHGKAIESFGSGQVNVIA